jgi:Outer membrane protein beta-barrel domain
MKRIFFLLLAPTFLTVHAQDAKKQSLTNKLLIGFNFSPDYNFRTLKNKGGEFGDLVVDSRNSAEIGKLGYTTGFAVCLNFSEQIALETGIQYSNKGYKTKNIDLIISQPDPNFPIKVRTSYSYQYIGVPLRAKFTFGKSKVRFAPSAGFMTNFLLGVKQTSVYEYANGETDERKNSMTGNFNKIDISTIISLGVDYKLNDKTHLIAEPTFRYGMISTKDAPVTEQLWNTGINVGVYFGIK